MLVIKLLDDHLSAPTHPRILLTLEEVEDWAEHPSVKICDYAFITKGTDRLLNPSNSSYRGRATHHHEQEKQVTMSSVTEYYSPLIEKLRHYISTGRSKQKKVCLEQALAQMFVARWHSALSAGAERLRLDVTLHTQYISGSKRGMALDDSRREKLKNCF